MAFLKLADITNLQKKLKEWLAHLKPKKKDDRRLYYSLEQNAKTVHILQGKERAKEFSKVALSDSERVFKIFPDGKIFRQIPQGNIQWGLMLPNGKYTKLLPHGDISKTLSLEIVFGGSNCIYFLQKDNNSLVIDGVATKLKRIRQKPKQIQQNRISCLENLGTDYTVDQILKCIGFVDPDFRQRLAPEIKDALKSVQSKLMPVGV